MERYYPIDVKPLEQYRLLITFDNNERRVFDVTPYLNDNYFAPLQNKTIFNSVKTNSLTIVLQQRLCRLVETPLSCFMGGNIRSTLHSLRKHSLRLLLTHKHRVCIATEVLDRYPCSHQRNGQATRRHHALAGKVDAL